MTNKTLSFSAARKAAKQKLPAGARPKSRQTKGRDALRNKARLSKSSLNGTHGEFTGSDDVKGKMAKQASLKVAKMAANMVLKNKVVRGAAGKTTTKAVNKMVNRAIAKKAQRIKGRGAYSGSGFYAGRGSYETVSNQLMVGSGAKPASLSSSGDETGEILVSKREYLTDIYSTGLVNFYLESFAVNPGLNGVFPFLSQIATNYTSYEFVQLIFEYVPVVSQASTTGAMGTVILACNGNAASAPFASKVEMNEYEGAISGRVCDHMVLGVECDPKKLGLSPTLYVRAGSVPSGQDQKTYDLGLFQVALSGVSPASFPANTQLGELWVHYRIKLRKPRLYDALGYNIPTDTFIHTGVGCTIALPFGTAPSKSQNNAIGGRLSKAGTTVYTFPDNFTGFVNFVVFIQGGVVTSGNQLCNPSGNISNVNDLQTQGVAAATVNLVVGTFGYTQYHCFVREASVPGGNFMTIAVQTTYTGATAGSIIVEQYNPLPGFMFVSGTTPSSMVPV